MSGVHGQPQLSPDGKLAELLTFGGGGAAAIWSCDLQRDAMSGVTFGEENFTFPHLEQC